jgi:hypothetical protein
MTLYREAAERFRGTAAAGQAAEKFKTLQQPSPEPIDGTKPINPTKQ